MKIKECHEKLDKCVQQFKIAPIINEFIQKMKSVNKNDSNELKLQPV